MLIIKILRFMRLPTTNEEITKSLLFINLGVLVLISGAIVSSAILVAYMVLELLYNI